MVKVKSKKELAMGYGVSLKTLCKWIVPQIMTEEEYRGIRIFKPNQLREIYRHLDNPFDGNK